MKKSNLFTILLSSTFLVACGGGGGGGGGGGSSASASTSSVADFSHIFPDTIQAKGKGFSIEYPEGKNQFVKKLIAHLESELPELKNSPNQITTNQIKMFLYQNMLNLKIGGVDFSKLINIQSDPSSRVPSIAVAPGANTQGLTIKTISGEVLPLTSDLILNLGYQMNIEVELILAKGSVTVTEQAPGVGGSIHHSTPEDITTKRGPLTSAAMRGSDTGSIDLRESFGQKFDLKLPLHVRVVGDTNLKETSNTLGSVFYKAGNSLFGVAQAYANQGNAFDVGGKQLETSAVSTFTLGNAFAEFQSGIVSADKVSGSNWSGSRQAMFLGYDIAGGISPFVQVSARQLSQENGVNHKESGAYVGTTVDRTKTNAFFNLTSLMTVKSGLVSDKASKGQHSLTASSFDHSVHMEQGFGSEGVSFNTSVGLSTKQNTNLKVAVGFSQ